MLSWQIELILARPAVGGYDGSSYKKKIKKLNIFMLPWSTLAKVVLEKSNYSVTC